MLRPPHIPQPGRLLRLSIPCDLASARTAAKSVRAFLEAQGLPEPDAERWELVLAEAANNTVLHTEPGRRTKPLELLVLCDPEQVELRLIDETPGFDWPDQAALPDPLSEHGRGLYLIQTLTDQSHYYRGRAGNCLLLTKARGATAALAPMEACAAVLRRRVRELETTLAGMTEELASCYESLSAIFQFSSAPAAGSDLADFARDVLGHLLNITNADWYVLRLWQRESQTLVPLVVFPERRPLAPLALSAPAQTACAETQSVAQRQDVWLDPARLAVPDEPLTVMPPAQTGLIHPFFLNDELTGTLALGRAAADEPFTAAQVNVVHTFADFLALQLMNRRYKDNELRAQLATRELEIAAEIQHSLIPERLPQPAGWSVAGYCRSARQAGGDYYDVVACGTDGLFVVVADVMGKGLPAAMLAAILRAVVRAHTYLYPQPALLLRRMNDVLFADLDRLDMFITAQVLYLDTNNHTLLTAGAGHCLPLLCQPAAGRLVSIHAGGLPLGVERDSTFTEAAHALNPGDVVLVHTDGITELRNERCEFLGVEGLVRWLRQAAANPGSASALQASLLERLRAFQGAATVADDQTFVFLRDERS